MADGNRGSRAKISRPTKAILVGQSLVISVLSLWLYKEYLDNQYLQTYLSGVLQGQGSIVALLGLGGILAIGLVGILLKAGNIMEEIEHMSSKVDDPSGPVPIVEAPSIMPILEAVPPPSDDISQIHGSMRRWNEQSRRGNP